MKSRALATAVLLAAVLIVVDAASADSNAVRWFHSPSGNIECEVASHDARGTYAYCQTSSPLQTARLTGNGRTSVCANRACPVGDGPTNATTLLYGHSVRVGVFRCASAVTGIRCTVIANGHGFRIAREGIVTF